MSLRMVFLNIFLIFFSFTNISAQVIHIHMGEENRAFNLADIDSISFVDLVISLSVEPNEIDFGEVAVGNVQDTRLIVTNTGNGELIINSANTGNDAFEVAFEEPISLRPGSSIDLIVWFAPIDGGEISSEITIHSNSPENPELAIPVSGTGTRPFLWEFVQTDVNMSVLIDSAMIGEELVQEGDLIGAFTADGQCCGYSQVPEGFPERELGLSAWGAENDMDNGFQAGEQLTFRIWDASAFSELQTEFEIIGEGEPVFEAGGFIQVRINAILE